MNRLGELERAIMDVLWESPEPLTVRQVSGQLTERDLAHTTVMTVLDRLAKKGFARRGRDGRAWRYRAAESREAYVTELMLHALDQTGDRQAALARFVRSVSGAEARALRRALEALDRSDQASRTVGPPDPVGPADSAEVPADSAEVPADSAEVPADSAEVPADSAEVPADSAEVTVKG